MRAFRGISFMGGLTTLALAAMMCSCHKKTEEPSISETEFMEKYMEAQAEPKTPFEDGYNAYFDFSDGVNCAYNVAATKGYLQDIVNKLNDNNTDFYSLANHEITLLDDPATERFNKIMNPASYRNQAAPIVATLEAIVNGNRPSFLVTDFEEYDGKIQKSAYARPYFKKWLERGNDITFLIMDYKEGGKAKKIYFTIFDGPNDHKLLKEIRDAIGGSSEKNYQEFTLANNNYSFHPKYPSSTQGGGFKDENGDDGVTFVAENQDADPHYLCAPYRNHFSFAEFYPLNGPASYLEIKENAAEAYNDPARPYPPYTFTDIFRNNFIGTENFNYNNLDYEVRVYDVTADIEAFAGYLDILDQNPGPGIANDQFYDVQGVLKPEYVYHPANPKELPAVVDLFEFDPNPAVDPTKPGLPDNLRELAVKFSSKFNGEVKGAKDDSYLRVDIVLKKADVKTKEELDPLFKWGDYDNLSESVRHTLADMNPEGQTIYTYYVKIY